MFFTLLSILDSNLQIDFAAMIWCLWKRRNDMVWNEIEKPMAMAVHEARLFVSEWCKYRTSNSTQTQQQQQPAEETTATRNNTRQQQHHWVKPSVGRLKCNIDGAWFVDQLRCGFGMCIRDHEGGFIAAKTGWFDGYLAPPEIEAMGLLEALKWLLQLNINNVDLELDCKQVVDAMKDRTTSSTEFGSIISNCKLSFHLLSNCAISFIRRQANCVAHSLARAAQFYASHHVHDFIPLCISTILMNEMA